ncbi:hypothetical protein PMZ80_006755 [Knufia obscura]|uniref:Uncharacterized protein n=1 Tax=Knufia obscura TaxID=1635080 RepID=A0ABR0RLI4_9EURO|nr:hypothetical protein PMZ80_006755 [Knufia obscura]
MSATTPPKNPQITNRDDYYRFVMDEYAAKGSGLISPLIPDCPGGDFAYTSYTWTLPQRLVWKLDRRPPCHINDLPGNPLLLLQSIHIPRPEDRIATSTSLLADSNNDNDIDIIISKHQFTRLNAITTPGLRIWVLDPNLANPHFVMIPSHAMVFTDDEKRKYRVDGFRADRSDMPTLRGILRRAEADPG